MSGDPRIRASDADRERTATLLREHHAVGRLTAEEFDERLDKAFAARTMGDLEDLLADLPGIDLYQLPDASLPRQRGYMPGVLRMSALSGRLARMAAFSAALAGGLGILVQYRAGPAWSIWALAGFGYPWFAWDRRPVGRHAW